MKLIGVGGTNGSGKDTLAQYLAHEHGWLFVSGSDILRAELKQRGQPIERQHLAALSAEWRRQHSLGYLIDQAVEIYKTQQKDYSGLVISSLRNYGEADRVHQLGGQVVWLDAPAKLRYKRIYSRQRSSEDAKTFEQFQAEEQAEKEHAGDHTTLNWQGVKDRADIFITNHSNDLAEFKKTAQTALQSLL